MDRLQFNSFHLDGWIISINNHSDFGNRETVAITFQISEGQPTTATGRIRIIPDTVQNIGLVLRTFQGEIKEFNMRYYRPTVINQGEQNFMQPFLGMEQRTINLTISAVVYEGDDRYREDFVVPNYPQIQPRSEDINAFRDWLNTGLVGSSWGKDYFVSEQVENKFEPESSNRLKQIEDFDIIPSTGEKMNKYTLFEYLELEQVGSVISESKEPGHDDITDLIEVAQKMPRTPEEIEDFAASFIATISLNALYHCNELRARASVYVGNKKVDLDSVYGALIESSNKAATVTKEISKSKPGYVCAAKEFEKAKAYVEFYTGLSSNFEKCHYWAKSREVANQQEFKGSAYEPHHDSDSGKGEVEIQHREVRAETEMGHRNSLREAKPVEDVNF